jgi:hypothetical protein
MVLSKLGRWRFSITLFLSQDIFGPLSLFCKVLVGLFLYVFTVGQRFCSLIWLETMIISCFPERKRHAPSVAILYSLSHQFALVSSALHSRALHERSSHTCPSFPYPPHHLLSQPNTSIPQHFLPFSRTPLVIVYKENVEPFAHS